MSTLAVLQGVMKRAVRAFKPPSNPVKQINKPSQRSEREPRLGSVEQVESMRLYFRAHDDLRSATLLGCSPPRARGGESEALRFAGARYAVLFRATKRACARAASARASRPC
ncbi:MAG TPA: hypothetical protein VFP55_12210 [Solirubrobacteraceae bacterium]|nr:hypothetical protein [Solirubrobacteraceae bacterium]